jgi:hypothetical protein
LPIARDRPLSTSPFRLSTHRRAVVTPESCASRLQDTSTRDGFPVPPPCPSLPRTGEMQCRSRRLADSRARCGHREYLTLPHFDWHRWNPLGVRHQRARTAHRWRRRVRRAAGYAASSQVPQSVSWKNPKKKLTLAACLCIAHDPARLGPLLREPRAMNGAAPREVVIERYFSHRLAEPEFAGGAEPRNARVLHNSAFAVLTVVAAC